jgi:hypothetical protein
MRYDFVLHAADLVSLRNAFPVTITEFLIEEFNPCTIIFTNFLFVICSNEKP